jgi:hypothetical protein
VASLGHNLVDPTGDQHQEVKIMGETVRDDIRNLLKEFGVRADGAVVTHLARNPDLEFLQLRLTLEDLTDYGDLPPEIPLSLTVEGEVSRRS